MRKKFEFAARRLVVVDVENVVGGAVLDAGAARLSRRIVERALPLRAGDHVIIGASHASGLESGLAWEPARLLCRSGENGADLALLEVLEGERVADRFEKVVLVSGDGIFADAVAQLGASGVNVTVVAYADRCARRLRMAAARTICLQRETINHEEVA